MSSGSDRLVALIHSVFWKVCLFLIITFKLVIFLTDNIELKCSLWSELQFESMFSVEKITHFRDMMILFRSTKRRKRRHRQFINGGLIMARCRGMAFLCSHTQTTLQWIHGRCGYNLNFPSTIRGTLFSIISRFLERILIKHIQ